jgi:hypothetical protein
VVGEGGGVKELLYTVKKVYSFSRPQPGCHLPNTPQSERVWLVTSRLGIGKTKTFFTVYIGKDLRQSND